MKVCDECGGKHYAKGKCQFHYRMPSQLNPKPIGTVTDITKEWKAKNSKSTDVVNKKFYVKVVPIKAKKVRDSLPELLKLAEIVFNKWIRNRDKIDDFTFVCIACDMAHPLDQMDAGHYRTKMVSSLRFNEHNINGECQSCNRHDNYHLIGYRENLIRKIGLENVEALDRVNFGEDYKWNRSELLEIISKYKF